MIRHLSRPVGLLLVLSLSAQTRFELTVDNIMRGPALYGYPPRDVRWSGNGARVYFEWKQYSDPLLKDFDTYVVNRDGSGLRKLTEEEAKLVPPGSAATSKDRKWSVYTRDGDLYLYERATDTARRLTRTVEAESNPHFTADARKIIFTRSGNLYSLSIHDGVIEQLTDIRPPGSKIEGEEEKGTESQELLKKEELSLFETVRERAKRREEEKARRRRDNPRKPFVLPANSSVRELQLSPDGKYVIASIQENAQKAKRAMVPKFVTESAYTEPVETRAKVGDELAKTRMAIVSVQTGEWKWIETEPKDRPISLSMPVWSDDGTRAVLSGRAVDNKDRWIYALDIEGAKLRVLFHEHDEAWIQAPGLSNLGWLKDDRTVWFQSEKSGYSHIYSVPFEGGEARQITSGKWEVTDARLTPDKTTFYLITNEVYPGERHIYSMPAEGGSRIKLSGMPGASEDFDVSPDGKMLAFVYSYSNKPPEVYLQENRPGAVAARVTSSPAPDFHSYPWIAPEVVTIPARDGATIYARLYKPSNFKKGGPAVVFVHGAGYLQNAHRYWSSYSREYLFHHLLMERGYIVIDADYRASEGYGRDWRTAIYRHMGGKDLDDNIDAARWLVTHHGVDPKRIGIYGGSYGGFITLMAMFTQPDVFAAGAALRPVTDWAHYNHEYTSNILNTPQKDPEAFKKSSPIYFAEGLKGALLICHGMADVNVHFQDSVRLVQRLIELRKENWELAVYPVEDHGFVEPTSWADEYKRILKLFETNLKR